MISMGTKKNLYIELYPWNLYNFINQCHPNKFNKEINKMVIDDVNMARKHYLLSETLNIFSSKQEMTWTGN